MTILDLLYEQAQKTPYKKALIYPMGRDRNGKRAYTHFTFREFHDYCEQLAAYFLDQGIKPQDKILLFVKPSLEFPLIVYALLRMGAVVVLIDPAMGLKLLRSCVQEIKPQVLIGEPIVCALSALVFGRVGLSLSVRKIAKLLPTFLNGAKVRNFVSCQPSDTAAIVFTSGGTGKPKGVVYTHEIFLTQVKVLKNLFSMGENDIEMSGFPLFSLFSMAMGVSSVIPDMDTRKPAAVDARLLIEGIKDQGVTLVSGSPAIWERVGRHCHDQQIRLDGVRAVMMFGAPVSLSIHKLFESVLPDGSTYTPYGATECLPVCCLSGKDILKHSQELMLAGKGTALGWACEGTEIRIIPQSDAVFADIHELTFCAPYEVGEIIVKGAQVTPRYEQRPLETQKSKIKDGAVFWHRMGDLGFLDDQGQLWFCGRKAHRVEIEDATLYPIPCEAIFNQHPEIKRTALISLAGKKAGLVVERWDAQTRLSPKEHSRFFSELLSLGQRFSHTSEIKDFFLHKSFPVDVRHNIKIDRQALSVYFSRCLWTPENTASLRNSIFSTTTIFFTQ